MWEPGCLQRYSLPFHSYLIFRKGIWKAPAVKGVGAGAVAGTEVPLGESLSRAKPSRA